MTPDVLYIILLTTILYRILPGNIIGCCLVSILFFALAKIIPHCILGGWTFPVNPDPSIHKTSGTIALTIVTLFYMLVWYCKKRKIDITKQQLSD